MKNCQLFLIYLLVFGLTNLNAQSNDHTSLGLLINTTTGEEKVKNLLLLAEALVQPKPDSCLIVSAEALKLADSLHNRELAAEAHYIMGMAYHIKRQYEKAYYEISKSLEYADNKGDYKLLVKSLILFAENKYENLQYDSARNLLETAKAEAEKHNFDNSLANIYNNLAKIENKEGNQTEAIDGYLKAAKLFRQQNRIDALAVVYENIGGLHYDLKNYHDAIQYCNMALDINKRENIFSAIINNYNSLGTIYSKIDSLDKALYYYNLVIETAYKNNNEYNLAKGYLNMANLLNMQGIYDDAGRYYDSAIHYSQKNNIAFGLIISKLNQGKYYNNIGDHTMSLAILREVKKIIYNKKIPDMEATLYSWISDAFEGLGVYDSALYYFKLYEHINDSLHGKETKETVLALEKKYQSELKARQIAELQKNITIEKSHKRLIIISFMFLAIVLVAIIFLLLARRRTARLREQLIHQENEKLKTVMELRNQELVCKALMVSNLNEQIDKINHHVQQLNPSLNPETAEKLNILVKDLEITLPEHAWHEFETRFEQVHQGFFTRLITDYPDLSPTELKICSLLRLNMSTKDIALLTNRSIGTVDNIRSSIRKKLQLDAEANLTACLLNF